MAGGRLRAGLETDLLDHGFNPNCLAMDFPFARPAQTPAVVLPREIPRRIDRPGKQEKYLVRASSPGFFANSDRSFGFERADCISCTTPAFHSDVKWLAPSEVGPYASATSRATDNVVV
jgi:hypothetical protein